MAIWDPNHLFYMYMIKENQKQIKSDSVKINFNNNSNTAF